MRPIISQVCTLNAPFEQDVEDFAAGHCHAIEVWLTKLEAYIAKTSLSSVREVLEEFQMAIPVASYQGGLLDSQGEKRAVAWASWGDRLKLCQELQIGTIVVACDVAAPLTREDMERVQFSLAELARQGTSANIRIAVEFQARAALGNNLLTMSALIDEARNQTGSTHLGICFDLFHYFVGPSQESDLSLLHPENLFHVQISDLADTPREFASDSDRIMPGEGDIPLVPVLEHLRQIDYRGAISLELMNPQIWQVPPRQFGEIAITSLRKILGQAEE